MLDQKLLKELIHYDPETGFFTWRERDRRHFKTLRSSSTWNARYAGKPAGSSNGKGYLKIGVFNGSYKSHRLAFLYIDGEFPPADTDHINGVRDDNRWVNLRAVTNSENHKNMRRYKANSSGFAGVHWVESSRKWRAIIVVNKKQKHLGCFTDKFDAIDARKDAEREYKFHPNHGKQ